MLGPGMDRFGGAAVGRVPLLGRRPRRLRGRGGVRRLTGARRRSSAGGSAAGARRSSAGRGRTGARSRGRGARRMVWPPARTGMRYDGRRYRAARLRPGNRGRMRPLRLGHRNDRRRAAPGIVPDDDMVVGVVGGVGDRE